MRRITLTLFVALAMILASCGGSNGSDGSERELPPKPKTTVAAKEYLESPNLVAFCDKESGICAEFPAETFETLIEVVETNADSRFTEHHQISSAVKFKVGDGYSEYCGLESTGCDETETYTIVILPDNEVNSAAALKLDGGCTFEETTVTGVSAKLKSCVDGIPSLEELVVFSNGYIFVASAESSDNSSDADWQENFFLSIGLKTA